MIMTSPSPFYQHKPEDYYRHARTDILAFLGDIEGQSILELGAGGGFTLAYAKTVGLAAYVAGVELFDLPHNAQREAVLTNFIGPISIKPPWPCSVRNSTCCSVRIFWNTWWIHGAPCGNGQRI